MTFTTYLRSLVVMLAICHTHATQVMQRPSDYATKTKPNIAVRRNHVHGRHSPSIGQFVSRADMGRLNVGYFTNWGIYGRGFYPQDIDVSSLTHILYAFADVSPDSGAVALSDTWSDQQKHYAGDSWDDTGNNLYGNFKQLYLLKKSHRSINVLLSIGGWTYSQAGHFNFVTDDSKRATFVSSALTILEDNGLDGFDLDFEYPTAGAQAQAFSKLLSELRTALNALATKKGDTVPYQISAAVPAGANNYQGLPIKDIDPSLSFWNLMAYDYAGSWSAVADHQANLYGPSFNNVSTDIAVKWYIANGACPGKINIGIPLYGRGFENTGGIGKPFNGVGSGTWEAGIYDYKVLPFSGAAVAENSTLGASYSYDSTKKQLISYDTPNITAQKAQYIVDNQLGGAMFWDLSGDKTGAESLVGRTAGVFGSLDNTQNHLNYPDSKFDNLKNGMAGSQNETSAAPSSNTTGVASTNASTSSSEPSTPHHTQSSTSSSLSSSSQSSTLSIWPANSTSSPTQSIPTLSHEPSIPASSTESPIPTSSPEGSISNSSANASAHSTQLPSGNSLDGNQNPPVSSSSSSFPSSTLSSSSDASSPSQTIPSSASPSPSSVGPSLSCAETSPSSFTPSAPLTESFPSTSTGSSVPSLLPTPSSGPSSSSTNLSISSSSTMSSAALPNTSWPSNSSASFPFPSSSVTSPSDSGIPAPSTTDTSGSNFSPTSSTSSKMSPSPSTSSTVSPATDTSSTKIVKRTRRPSRLHSRCLQVDTDRRAVTC